MTEMQKYLAEEVGEDLADGIITRREALRRLNHGSWAPAPRRSWPRSPSPRRPLAGTAPGAARADMGAAAA